MRRSPAGSRDVLHQTPLNNTKICLFLSIELRKYIFNLSRSPPYQYELYYSLVITSLLPIHVVLPGYLVAEEYL